MNHILKVNGREMSFVGSPIDPYFQRLEAFHENNRELAALLSSATDDAVTLDIGANIGLTALTIATATPRGHVFAFEPLPQNAEFLRQNVRANGIQNVTVVEAAVGVGDGEMVSMTVPVCGAHAAVIRSPEHKQSASVSVPLTSLDEWATRALVKRVDLIKVDVEGYEPDVLYGGAALLASVRPTILMEFNSITIIMEACGNPLIFAETLASAFEIFRYNGSAMELVRNDELRRFVFGNLTERGFIDDILLRLRASLDAVALRRTIAPLVSARPLSSKYSVPGGFWYAARKTARRLVRMP
jgi:FkbM family methyltransferase